MFWIQELRRQEHPELSSFSPRQPWNNVIKISAASKQVDEENARKRQYDPQREDGRYMKSFNGINICYDWARNKDGCENTACQNTWRTCGNGVANPIGQWIAHKFQDGSLEINQTREKDVEKAGEGTGQGVADVR